MDFEDELRNTVRGAITKGEDDLLYRAKHIITEEVLLNSEKIEKASEILGVSKGMLYYMKKESRVKDRTRIRGNPNGRSKGRLHL